MAVLQPITDLAEVCYLHGIRKVVISPGSRSASLTLAFTRHGGFDIKVVMDERAAGFIALGMAQQLKQPVILICTSGSAAYNYAPAVAEAFFQQIPLVIFTADRPREWIHQHDGQTIYQSGIYGEHVRKYFEIPSDYEHKDSRWFINRSVNEAILTAGAVPPGPVHINVPIREPFYPTEGEEIQSSSHVRIINRNHVEKVLSTDIWHELLNEWEAAGKILIVGGQCGLDERLNTALTNIASEFDVPVVGDVISNQKGSELFITHHDLFLREADSAQLVPDLLITYGLSLISKELKQFLRKNPAVQHWHIAEDEHLVDTFHSLTRQILVSPSYFFNSLFEKIDYQLFTQGDEPGNDSVYGERWHQNERRSALMLSNYLKNLSSLNDLTCIDEFILSLSNKIQLHVANSMAIRYVNILGRRIGAHTIFCNRGTSGIDGCVSTAIGSALATVEPVYLITGDVAFLYDRNGLLLDSLPANLKILVINNAGGNIFRLIDGPARLPELETYFETRHGFTAERTAQDSDIAYFSAGSLGSFHEQLRQFVAAPSTAIFEVFTDPATNGAVWNDLKEYIKRHHVN